MIERALREKKRREKVFERKEDGTIVWRWDYETAQDYDWPYYGNVLKPGQTKPKGHRIASGISYLPGHIKPNFDEDEDDDCGCGDDCPCKDKKD